MDDVWDQQDRSLGNLSLYYMDHDHPDCFRLPFAQFLVSAGIAKMVTAFSAPKPQLEKTLTKLGWEETIYAWGDLSDTC